MAVPTFYVETSVWGCLAPRQPRDRKVAVKQLLKYLDGKRGICVVSTEVLAEIEAAPQSAKAAIQLELMAIDPFILPPADEVPQLAQAYIASKVIPERRKSDAIHVAAATVFEIDYLVSWNHRHMTRPMKRLQYESVNRLHGYPRTPLICNPLEARDEFDH